MSASKFCLFGAALLRSPRAPHTLPPILPAKPFFPQSLQFRQLCSSVAVDTLSSQSTETSEQPLVLHPWPEWVTFVDNLMTKSYLIGSPLADDGEDGGAKAVHCYKDMNFLKDPCVRFARDRYDIFRSLSLQDIQALVECGCPNLLRKTVNSSKRLRAYLNLEEGDVCSSCNLRDSCDRAYVMLTESTAACTVDVVRILLAYALDPLVMTGDQKPPGRELAEVSARKLLAKLVELSETSPVRAVPAPPKPALEASSSKEKTFNSKKKSNLSQAFETKKGDWTCPKCQFLNFAKNFTCRKCKEACPEQAVDDNAELKKGDWICSKCQFMNFSRNVHCLKCKVQGPEKRIEKLEMKPGDWNCPKCTFMNFAKNIKCFRCEELRPKKQSGDWYCSNCDYLNYSGNEACRKCNNKQAKGEKTNYEEQLWRSPV